MHILHVPVVCTKVESYTMLLFAKDSPKEEEEQEMIATNGLLEEGFQGQREPEGRRYDEEAEEAEKDQPLTSIFRDITVFRDFFLAAFSDGYDYNVGVELDGDALD